MLILISLYGCFDEPSRRVKENQIVYAFPNPARDFAFVYVRNTTNDTGTLTVFDPKGDISLEQDVPPGMYDFEVELKSDGKYHVVCKIGDQAYTTVILRF